MEELTRKIEAVNCRGDTTNTDIIKCILSELYARENVKSVGIVSLDEYQSVLDNHLDFCLDWMDDNLREDDDQYIESFCRVLSSEIILQKKGNIFLGEVYNNVMTADGIFSYVSNFFNIPNTECKISEMVYTNRKTISKGDFYDMIIESFIIMNIHFNWLTCTTKEQIDKLILPNTTLISNISVCINNSYNGYSEVVNIVINYMRDYCRCTPYTIVL